MSKLKTFFKNTIGKSFSQFSYPIIVNSYGRSGSTVLTKSIVDSAIEFDNSNLKDIAFRSISQEAWDLNKADLKNGIVYKTHDYPPPKDFDKNIKMVYTFANPVDVVLSLLRKYDKRGEDWMRLHYNHLKVPYRNFDKIVRNDDLQLERHLESWLQEKRFPIAFIKYEKMWSHQEDISDFLGFEVMLPPYRKRKANQETDEKLIETIKKNYKPLIEKVSFLENFFTNQI